MRGEDAMGDGRRRRRRRGKKRGPSPEVPFGAGLEGGEANAEQPAPVAPSAQEPPQAFAIESMFSTAAHAGGNITIQLIDQLL